MTNNPNPKVTMWLPDPLPKDVAESLHRLCNSEDVQHVAVMPDVHLSGSVRQVHAASCRVSSNRLNVSSTPSVCNGVAVATMELVYPVAVGSDIGCGMLAIAIDLESDALSTEQSAGQLLSGLYQKVPPLKHPRSNRPADLPETLANTPLSHPALEKQKDRDGLFQLGTLGRGNHFVEFQSDADGRLWLMLHSGSRGLGQAITNHHLRSTQLSQSRLGFLDATTPVGQAYLSDVNWAIEYAIQNRLAMARVIESLLSDQFATTIEWSTLIHCHHNHVRRETHFGQQFLVHRKGALPAADQEPGVIPGSMGTHSYHVTGRGHSAALQSSSHGAGRALPRSIARHQISRQDLKRQMEKVWFDTSQIDTLRDESPAAYKDISRVMRAQRELTRIVRQLRPLLVYKGN